MAKYLEFDMDQVGINGLIPLRRGDDWRLVAALTNSNKFPVNLSTTPTIQVHFPGDPCLTPKPYCYPPEQEGHCYQPPDVVVEAQIIDVESNQISISVPDTATTGIALSPVATGLGIYAVMTDTMGNQTTFENPFPILEIKDRGFHNNL